ncbi:MAG TPA: 50S ribosomal protein L14e [Candidatus Nanoarchaeia archaeon]|nr:50S ribosomal protein L14e [Candidatus Nanoarchaeia archaeon]
MVIFDVGRVCLKIAGRDAGRKSVVVEVIDANFVVVDGDVRRKKVNVRHLMPLQKTIQIKNKASHEEVKAAFEKLGLGVWEKRSKKVPARAKKQKQKKVIAEKPKKAKTAKKSAESRDEKTLDNSMSEDSAVVS